MLFLASGCKAVPGASSSADALAIVDADDHDAALSLDGMGAKAPVMLASGQSKPNCLAVDASNVYWTTSDGNVMSVPISGGEPTVLASDQPSPLGIAVDASNVYWVNSSPDRAR